MKRIYVIGTCDTKARELQFVKSAIAATGLPVILVDVGTRGLATTGDVCASEVAEFHNEGRDAVLGLNDRGAAVAAMGEALANFLSTRDDISGVIGLGGGGNTALVTRGMRSLPIGLPKLMVSTIASGDVKPYIGPSDICMMPSITDVAGINRINHVVLGNAAHAIAGMVMHKLAEAERGLPTIGLTQFGVTTVCVDQVRAELEAAFECMVFHATGIGGQTMEKLVDSGFLSGLVDITTTEVADLIVGGVLPCTEDRFGAIARTKVPCVLSCGALDMVNFGPVESVPARFQHRRFYKHNPQVTLMRTTKEENAQFGEWIAKRLNACEGPVRLLVPEQGVSALDAPEMPFHDPAADRALFDALEKNFIRSPNRQLIYAPFHINDQRFAHSLVNNFREVGRFSISKPPALSKTTI